MQDTDEASPEQVSANEPEPSAGAEPGADGAATEAAVVSDPGAIELAVNTATDTATAAAHAAVAAELHRLGAVEVEVQGVLGETTVRLGDLLTWLPGSIVLLDRRAGVPADLRVEDTCLARGDVVVVDECYGLRVTALGPSA